MMISSLSGSSMPDTENHATDTRMVDGGNDIVPSSLFGDHFTPKKSMRRSYFDGNGEELRWNNELGAEQTNILEKEGSAGSSMSRIDENGVMNQSIPNPKPCLARRDESTAKIAAVDFQPSRVGCGFCQTDDRTGGFKPDVAPRSIHENGVKVKQQPSSQICFGFPPAGDLISLIVARLSRNLGKHQAATVSPKSPVSYFGRIEAVAGIGHAFDVASLGTCPEEDSIVL